MTGLSVAPPSGLSCRFRIALVYLVYKFGARKVCVMLAPMRRAGLIASELGPRQRLPAHGEKMLAYKAEQRLGTGETMRRREFIALVGASVVWPF